MIREDTLVQLIADACLEEKALNLVILDVRDLTVLTDYFVIASGRNFIQVKSIIQNVEETLEQYGIKPIRKEGQQQGVWAVLDYNSTILHVFREEEREYYNLESLWGDAREVSVENQ